MSALRRVVRAPGLWVSLYALQLALALVLARPLRAAVSAALEPFAYTGPLEGLLMTFGRLSSQNAAVMAVATSALVTGTLLGLLLWIVAGGGIIRRLAGPCKPGEAFAAAITYTPKIALVTPR